MTKPIQLPHARPARSSSPRADAGTSAHAGRVGSPDAKMHSTQSPAASPAAFPAAAAREPKHNARTCVGCAGEALPDALLRFVAEGDTLVFVGRSSSGAPSRGHGVGLGRGASVHATAGCLRRALSTGFVRAFRRPLALEGFAANLFATLTDRGRGLLVTALRVRAVAIGADAALAALSQGRDEDEEFSQSAVQLVIATDAASIAEDTRVVDAIGRGRALAMFTKEELGAVLGRDQVAIVAITQSSIAGELRRLQGELAAVRVLLNEPIVAASAVRPPKGPRRGGRSDFSSGGSSSGAAGSGSGSSGPGSSGGPRSGGGGGGGRAAQHRRSSQRHAQAAVTRTSSGRFGQMFQFNGMGAASAAPATLRDESWISPQIAAETTANRNACRIPEVR